MFEKVCIYQELVFYLQQKLKTIRKMKQIYIIQFKTIEYDRGRQFAEYEVTIPRFFETEQDARAAIIKERDIDIARWKERDASVKVGRSPFCIEGAEITRKFRILRLEHA